MVVIFYETTADGSKEIARVNYQDGELKGPQPFIDLLLHGGRNVEDAMHDAPKRFSGSYLRAEFRS